MEEREKRKEAIKDWLVHRFEINLSP